MALSLQNILTALKPSYRSIDLRSVFVTLGDGQGWRAVWTVLRFSSKSPEEITKEHAAIKERHSLNAQFCESQIDSFPSPDKLLALRSVDLLADSRTGLNVELSSYGVDEFARLVQHLSQGVIECKSRAIRVWINTGSYPEIQRSWFDRLTMSGKTAAHPEPVEGRAAFRDDFRF